MTLLIEIVTWFDLHLSSVTEVPTWLFWTALPFTVIGTAFIIFLGWVLYTAGRGMQRGL